MELRNIETFILAAELNSFTRAAERLDYAQSTVTAQIKALERELGIELFVRNGKRITLSAAGRDLLCYARQLQAMEYEIRSHFIENSCPIGRLHIGLLESISASAYMDFLGPFLKKYPQVQIKVTIDTTLHLMEKLRKGEVDVIVLVDRLNLDRAFRIMYSTSVPIVFFSSADAEIQGNASITLKELARETWLLTEKGCNYRKVLEEELALRGLYIDSRLEIGSTKGIIDLVAQGAGVSLLPLFDLIEPLKQGQVRRLDVNDYGLDMDVQILVSRERWLSPAVRCFCADFEEILKRIRMSCGQQAIVY